MQKHIKVYLENYPDGVCCEVCGGELSDVHHIIYRSKFGKKTKHLQDEFSNLIGLCRRHHQDAHSNILTKEYLQGITKKRF